MNPLDKLREDVQYYRQVAREAREALRVAEAVLPGLEAQLRELDPELEQEAPPAREAPRPKAAEAPAVAILPSAATGSGEPRFEGQCEEQVLQALTWKPDQSSEDLSDTLRKYGRAYGRGAIGYALRDLRTQGKIEPSRKEGNSIFYRLVKREAMPPVPPSVGPPSPTA